MWLWWPNEGCYTVMDENRQQQDFTRVRKLFLNSSVEKYCFCSLYATALIYRMGHYRFVGDRG